MDREPNAIIRPSIRVAIADSLLRVFLVGVVGTPFLMPVVQRTAVGSLATGLLPGPLVTALTLFAIALVLEGARAMARRYTTTYRIYDERVEVVSGFRRTETTVLPRANIDQVTLTAGILVGHIGGGNVEISVAADNTNYRVTLRDITGAGSWYRTLRPVKNGTPLETFHRSLGPSLVSMLTYLGLGLGSGIIIAAVGLWSLGRGVSLTLILLGAVLVAYAVTALYFFYIASIEYRIYADHIERNRLFFGSERSYIVAENIDGVEHVRTVTERLFDVGTISISVRWRDRPFQLRGIVESEEVYERLRMSA